MKTCTRCRESKSLTEFYKRAKSEDKLQRYCKSCMAVSYADSRNKKKPHYIAVAKTRRNSIQNEVSEWKTSRGCSCCKETFAPCLELHHLDPSQKEGDPSAFKNSSFQAFLEEAKKCIVLCANCHRKVHHGALVV